MALAGHFCVIFGFFLTLFSTLYSATISAYPNQIKTLPLVSSLSILAGLLLTLLADLPTIVEGAGAGGAGMVVVP